MTNLAVLGAPYDYVQTEEVISDVKELLQLDQALSGTSSASIIITREKLGGVDLLRLRGLGKNLWEGIDAQEYINNLREEWEK